jgi:hypothetical protein
MLLYVTKQSRMTFTDCHSAASKEKIGRETSADFDICFEY